MGWVANQIQSNRSFASVAIWVVAVGALFTGDRVWAGDRKFLVILANSPKQFPNGGEPQGGFVNRELIDRQYFDTVPGNGIFSFAEYWEEISYGDVRISGRTVGWIDLPWSIQPPLTDPNRHSEGGRPPVGENIEDTTIRITPADYYDLNASGGYEYGAGENFNNENAQSIIDITGDPLGIDDGPFFVGPGSSDDTQRGRPNFEFPVWMPGERFADVDDDGRWDGLDENLNWMDWDGDNRPDLAGPWNDLNENFEVENAANCSCGAGQGCYLEDSDNDKNPDCCPDGPCAPGVICAKCPVFACPPTTWMNQAQATITDCNGNLIDDALDIDPLQDGSRRNAVSRDVFPYAPVQVDTQNQCRPGPGDGVPDECQFQTPSMMCSLAPANNPDGGRCCRAVGASGGNENPCNRIPECVPVPDGQFTPRPRCESADSLALGGDGDGQLDIVEPFENFIRRWDPCIFDPEASAPNFQRAQTHWIKLYDPISPVARVQIPCIDPDYFVDYGDPSYIINNYPGDPKKVIEQAQVRPLYAQRDPRRRLGAEPCICEVGIGLLVLTGADDCCDASNFKARLMDGIGGRRCYPSDGPGNPGIDVNNDGRIDPATEVDVCVQVFPVENLDCRSFDVNENGLPDDDERGLCIAGFHAEFNPPDFWRNQIVDGPAGTMRSSTKMQAVGAPSGGFVPMATNTPEPGTNGSFIGMGEQAWFDQAWTDRYGETCFDVAGAETRCTPPDWPGNRLRRGNTPIMAPFVDAEEAGYDPLVNRRYFNANWGALNGDGTGLPENNARFLRYETGPLGTSGFEMGNDAAILPEEVDGAQSAGVFYDGYVEFDDLPSSKYHQAGDQWLGEIMGPFRTYLELTGTSLIYISGAERHNPAFGTGTEENRRIPAIWGDDRGNHNPDSPQTARDGTIMAAGPYARMVHGASGRDGGNNLLIELLTRRTDGTALNSGKAWEFWHGFHPYAGYSGENLGFRDFNLDGLVDQGEVRPAGSDNYIADTEIGGTHDGTGTAYPWNRRRLLEDCIEILDDDGPDFDDFVDSDALDAVTCIRGTQATLLPVQFWSDQLLETGQPVLEDVAFPTGISSGIVLLPAGAAKVEPDGDDFPTAPGYYPIHNEDGLNNVGNESSRFPRNPRQSQLNWNIFFHDLVTPLDRGGEGPTPSPFSTFLTDYSAHEYLHSWEGLPDLYDYDVFQPAGAQVNCPIGAWDIMAYGGLVHPSPVLKEGPCSDWVEPVDLTTVLTPGVDKVLTLPPAELVRDSSYFFLENESRLGERFYFWSAGAGFDIRLPGDPGMLIQHTDVGSNNDALPRQQRVPPFTYYIVQADGEDDLNSCVNIGDAGDPWPGSTGKTEFDCNTDPPARWYSGDACTGLRVSNITPDEAGSMRVTMNWVPTSIPGFRFIDPPGGASVGNPPQVLYQVRGEATDVFGGTTIRFFHTKDPNNVSLDPNGANFIGALKKNGPGTTVQSSDWNIAGLVSDRYHVFAELIPARGADGNERRSTTPRAGRNNTGNGPLTIHQVNTNELLGSGLFGRLSSTTSFEALNEVNGQPVNLSALGVQVGDQLTLDGFTIRRPALRTISSIGVGGRSVQFSPAITGTLPGVGPWQVARAGRTARAETWTAECITANGSEWRVFSSITQREPLATDANQDPYPHALTGMRYNSLNGAVSFTIQAGSQPFVLGDRFTFTTTGITAASSAVTVANQEINEGPTAVIEATPLAGDPPLRVDFDARNSVEPNGEPVQFRWNFGDGSALATGSQQSHTFSQARTFTVVLRVTNTRTGLFDESSVDIAVTNNSPNAKMTAVPTSGRAPLGVSFDGATSSDTETTGNNLIYQWDFGDGTGANTEARPGGAFSRTSHTYSRNATGQSCTPQAQCTFIAKLTVTDEGGKVDTDTVNIVVGNSKPTANITTSAIEGSDPLEVIFNGLGSTDPDGDPVTIEWKWGDGSPNQTFPSTGQPGSTDGSVKHTFRLAAGATRTTYTVTATARDGNGGATDWPGVTVAVNQPTAGSSDPQAAFTITPNPPILNEPFTVDARRSVDRPAGGTIASYAWQWGDGTPAGTGAMTTHTYTRAGTFTIILTVTDGDTPPHTGTKQEVVTVAGDGTEPPSTGNRAPSASFTVSPTSGSVGDLLTFDASASTDADGDDLTYAWSFGDGGTASGEVVQYAFEQSGNFLVRLTVADDQNGSADATQSVIVLLESGNRSPVVFVASGPRSGIAPLTLTFDGRNSYDPDGHALGFSWEFARDGQPLGEPIAGPVVTRTFSIPGSYTARLVVTDSLEASTVSSEEIVTVIDPSVVIDNDNIEPPVERPDPGVDTGDSAENRPDSAVCGLGMLMGFFGTFMGLMLMQLVRRPSRR